MASHQFEIGQLVTIKENYFLNADVGYQGFRTVAKAAGWPYGWRPIDSRGVNIPIGAPMVLLETIYLGNRTKTYICLFENSYVWLHADALQAWIPSDPRTKGIA